MKTLFPRIADLTFEETAEYLKIVMPLKPNWLMFGLFTLCLFVWIGMTGVMLVFAVRDVIFSGERFAFVFTIMLLVWFYVWYRYLGRMLWERWQYFTANREILFINKERLIVRRPVSILGITDAFDMKHVGPFYYNDQHRRLAFDYARQRIYFGSDLIKEDALRFIRLLNGRFFPHAEDEEE